MDATTYTFHRCLGRGGFGEVYLATRRTREGLEQRVAVTVSRQDLANTRAALARLRDEARMLAVLAHPAIVNVFELTQLQGRIALVTEYVDGADLSRFSPALPGVRGGMPARVACEVMAEVAGALATAVDTPSPDTGRPLGLVHRDVKPENVRIGRHGAVKLLDFGIARTEQLAREARTALGKVPVTLGYSAPEVLVAQEQDSASDVFSVGATLYRLLSGERFFGDVGVEQRTRVAASPQRFAALIDDRLQRIAHLPPPLVALLRSLLAHDPAARPSAGEVLRRLDAGLDLLDGPSLKRWARDTVFPVEEGIDAPLVGQVLAQDPVADVEPAVRRPPAPPAPPKELAELAALRPELDGHPTPARRPVSVGGAARTWDPASDERAPASVPAAADRSKASPPPRSSAPAAARPSSAPAALAAAQREASDPVTAASETAGARPWARWAAAAALLLVGVAVVAGAAGAAGVAVGFWLAG